MPGKIHRSLSLSTDIEQVLLNLSPKFDIEPYRAHRQRNRTLSILVDTDAGRSDLHSCERTLSITFGSTRKGLVLIHHIAIMGNSNTKESRLEPDAAGCLQPSPGDPSVREHLSQTPQRSSRRTSRAEINLFGIGSSSSRDRDRENVSFERRETKQEREARKLEKERAARLKERERSLVEEHVDGGYLVTLGTYTGTEDFGKAVVRQLQVTTL